MGSLSNSQRDMCMGLAAAVVTGGAVPPACSAALLQHLPNMDNFRC